jgi:glycogen operon protein
VPAEVPSRPGRSSTLNEAAGRGKSFPLGAAVSPEGVNFSVFSKHSTGAQLLLFDQVDDPAPSRVIELERHTNRTYHYWHTFVPGLSAGQIYCYRIAGPFAPNRGLRFDPRRLLLDPYGKCLARSGARTREVANLGGNEAVTQFKSVVCDPSAYDWEGDAPLAHPFAKTIIYEMHVRGFTQHSSSGVAVPRRGTYAGLIDKIPYLRDLGITAVELLPVFAFDERSGPPRLGNYWGYQPVSFFAPHPNYSSRQDPLGALDEFRDMVKALHRAGIEVLLDVVYNHTAEGNENGQTVCFRGLSNENYYILADDKSRYADYTGCGNTLNANEPIVRRLILDSLRYWVTEMHVDGFRFDLASILSRDADGQPMASPPILWDIESDPILANVKLIAEAWDAAGLYQVGSFVGDSWKEWNGRFRDDVRSFIKSDNGTVSAIAYRLTGSPDLYEREEREAEQSINFVACHDGFTLNDLVSFNGKHNEANGENNRDGADQNWSWNCGHEGPSDDPEIERLRRRQIKNLLAFTLLSIGVPMLLMGDEARRTQNGNNNAYCQDNEVSWFDWSLVERHAEIHRFAKAMIGFRMNRNLPVDQQGLTLAELLRRQPVQWHGVKLNAPDWSDHSHTIAATVPLLGYSFLLHVILNAYWHPLEFELPRLSDPQVAWRRCVDTYLDPPDDICSWAEAPPTAGPTYRAQPRSIVLLLARNTSPAGFS